MYLVVRWRRTITVGLSKCKLIRQDVYRFILWIRASLIDIHHSCKVHVRSSRSEWKLWMDDFFFQTGSHWPDSVYLLVSLLQVYKLVSARMILKSFYSYKFILVMDECNKITYYQFYTMVTGTSSMCVYIVVIRTHWHDCTPTSTYRIVQL